MVDNSHISDEPYLLPIALSDGHSTKITIYKNKNPEAPVALCLPAMGVRAEYYEVFALKLKRQGFHVVTSDLRGCGHSSLRASRQVNYGYLEILNIEFSEIIQQLRLHFNCEKVLLVGHSLGGQLSLLYACHDDSIHGVVMVASGSNWYANLPFPKNWIRRVLYRIALISTNVLGYFPGDFFRFAGKESKGLIKDWVYESRKGKYKVAGSEFDYEGCLSLVKFPVLFISLVGDNYVTRKCSEYLASKLTLAKTQFVFLDPQDYGLDEASHFRWTGRPKKVASYIHNWFQESMKTEFISNEITQRIT